MEALRYNEGKNRLDLIPPVLIEEVGKILTLGAKKYDERNWEKGMSWSKCIASLKRHLLEFEKGADYDAESREKHISHVIVNAMFLLEYYKTHPEKDDRSHNYLKHKRIGVDIDDTVALFVKGYCDKTGETIPSHWSFSNSLLSNFEKWKNEGTLDDFFLNLEPIIQGEYFPIQPDVYITSRPVSSEISTQWLEKNGFPVKPVETVERGDKVKKAKEYELDWFIDDNYSTFREMNAAGICCFLMDMPHNRKYEVGYKRIYSFYDFQKRFL